MSYMAYHEQKQEQEAPKPKTFTLDEIANKICDSYEECTEGECPGFYYCRHTRGHGVLAWLRKVVEE